jgi:hypothetical protein
MVPLREYEEKNTLYRDRKLYKLQLGMLDTGLQVKQKNVEYRNGLFREELEGPPDYQK